MFDSASARRTPVSTPQAPMVSIYLSVDIE
jgi:hypothetical protein